MGQILEGFQLQLFIGLFRSSKTNEPDDEYFVIS